MGADIFGDLKDWGRVLETIERVRMREGLEEHQAGLARILRYRENWRLADRVLRVVPEVRQASDLLIAEVCNILVMSDVHPDIRVRAARALGHLLVHRPDQVSSFDPARTLQTMSDVVARGCPPALEEALEEAISAAEASILHRVRGPRGERRVQVQGNKPNRAQS